MQGNSDRHAWQQTDLLCDPWSSCKLQSPAHSHEAGVLVPGGATVSQLQKSPASHNSQANRPARGWWSRNAARRSEEIQYLSFWNSVSRCWTSKYISSFSPLVIISEFPLGRWVKQWQLQIPNDAKRVF